MLYPDFEEFIASLNAHGVRYLIVGGHAYAFHAKPRATKDLDVYLQRTPANARRVLNALTEFFGGAELGYTVEDLMNPKLILQLGVAPVRIDLLNNLLGCSSFATAWKNLITAKFGDVVAHFLSREDLIDAKQAAGRPQDLADLATLKRIKPRPASSTTGKRREPIKPGKKQNGDSQPE